MITITYPAWHDRARTLREQGVTNAELAENFGLSPSTMAGITSPMWKQYLVHSRNRNDRRKGAVLKIADLDISGYEFVSIEKDKDMAENLRKFEDVYKFVDGKRLNGLRIRCSRCQAKMDYYKEGGTATPRNAEKHFTNNGWTVGDHPRKDLCYTHANERKDKPVVKLPDAVQTPAPIMSSDDASVTATKMAAAVNEGEKIKLTLVKPPEREMDKADKRLIYLKLNEVYVDEKTGYSDNWDDEKVAADLGVPVGWVASVRDADFGPMLNKNVLVGKFDDLIKLAQNLERTIVLIDKKIEQSVELDKKLTAQLAEMNAAVERSEQLVKELERQDEKTEEVIGAFSKDAEQFKIIYAELKAQASAYL